MSKAEVYPTQNRWVFSEQQLQQIYAKKDNKYKGIVASYIFKKNQQPAGTGSQIQSQAGQNSALGVTVPANSQIINEQSNSSASRGHSLGSAAGPVGSNQSDHQNDVQTARDGNSVKIPEFDHNDEKILLTHFVAKLLSLIEEVFGSKIHPRVKYQLNCSAVAIFRRFYLFNTPLDCDMGRAMKTCLLVAAKNCEIELKEQFYADYFTKFKFNSEVLVKTELKLLVATRFELIILDHTLVYNGLLLKLGIDGTARDDILAQLAKEDLSYFRSDLYFILNPLVYALAKFGIWLTKNRPTVNLASLWTSWDKPIQIAITYAQDKINSTEIQEVKSAEASIRKFDAFYKFVQANAATNRNLGGTNQEPFKRPTHQPPGMKKKATE